MHLREKLILVGIGFLCFVAVVYDVADEVFVVVQLLLQTFHNAEKRLWLPVVGQRLLPDYHVVKRFSLVFAHDGVDGALPPDDVLLPFLGLWCSSVER